MRPLIGYLCALPVTAVGLVFAGFAVSSGERLHEPVQ